MSILAHACHAVARGHLAHTSHVCAGHTLMWLQQRWLQQHGLTINHHPCLTCCRVRVPPLLPRDPSDPSRVLHGQRHHQSVPPCQLQGGVGALRHGH